MLTTKTVEVLAIAYIGGRGSIWGGAFTAFPFIFVFEWLRATLTELSGLHLVIYGLLLILVMIFYPGGRNSITGYPTGSSKLGGKHAKQLLEGWLSSC